MMIFGRPKKLEFILILRLDFTSKSIYKASMIF